MKKILVLCLVALITGACSDNLNDKATKLLQSERQVATEVKLDSIFDYSEAFNKKIEAICLEKKARDMVAKFVEYGNSLSDSERNTDEFQEKVSATKEKMNNLINSAKELKQSAATIELKNELQGKAPEFVGWSCTFNNDSLAYFDNGITKILATKAIGD